jgi:integrase/recombinase XerD
VLGKGAKELRVPVDRDVAALIQTYLLTERPDTDSGALFVVAKGPTRGRPLTPAGLRTVFRYHRARAGVSPPAAKKARRNLRSSSSSK